MDKKNLGAETVMATDIKHDNGIIIFTFIVCVCVCVLSLPYWRINVFIINCDAQTKVSK